MANVAAEDDAADEDPLLDANPPAEQVLREAGARNLEGRPTQRSPVRVRLYFGTKEVVNLSSLLDFTGEGKMEQWKRWWEDGEEGLLRAEGWLQENRPLPTTAGGGSSISDSIVVN